MGKKITEFTLISAVTETVNFVVDDSIQTYRATAAQIKAYINAENNSRLDAIEAAGWVNTNIADYSLSPKKMSHTDRHAVSYESNASFNFGSSTLVDWRWNVQDSLVGFTATDLGGYVTKFKANRTMYVDASFNVLWDDGAFSTSYYFYARVDKLDTDGTTLLKTYMGSRWKGNGANRYPNSNASFSFKINVDEYIVVRGYHNYPSNWPSYSLSSPFNTLTIVEK